jgi:hypothetical protein
MASSGQDEEQSFINTLWECKFIQRRSVIVAEGELAVFSVLPLEIEQKSSGVTLSQYVP